jgi:hypothetical protein
LVGHTVNTTFLYFIGNFGIPTPTTTGIEVFLTMNLVAYSDSDSEDDVPEQPSKKVKDNDNPPAFKPAAKIAMKLPSAR